MNTSNVKVCRFCGRSDAEVRLIVYYDHGGSQFCLCADERACEDTISKAEAAAQSPPVDQEMRALGAAELPGLWEER